MSIFNDLNRIGNKIQQLDARSSRSKTIRDPGEAAIELTKNAKISQNDNQAAGYFIGSNVNNRVSNVEQMLENMEFARHILEIIDPTLEDILDMLMEVKELAAKAANSEINPLSREAIGRQIESIGDMINERADETRFQDLELLNGEQMNGNSTFSGSLAMRFSVGQDMDDVLQLQVDSINVNTLYEGSEALNRESEGSPRGKLDLSQWASDDFRTLIADTNQAIDMVAEKISDLGEKRAELSMRELPVLQSISESLSEESRIRDTEVALAQSATIRNHIIEQSSASALAQANMKPQSVLGFLD